MQLRLCLSLGRLDRRLFSAGAEPVISIEFHAVRDNGMFIVINDEIESDALNGVFHVVDLYRAGQIPACPASGSGETALADDRILGAVGQGPGTAQFLLTNLFLFLFSGDQDTVIAPAVMARQHGLKPQIGKLVLQF